MILLLSVLAAATPVPNGHLIPVGDACYAISRISADGLKQIGTMRQTVQRKQHQGVDALEIATHQQIDNPKGMINMFDTYLVRRSDLRPISYRNVVGGKTSVDLAFTGDRVTGTKDGKDGPVSVDQKFNGPVWDSNIWGSLMASLPLKKGVTHRLPTYSYANGLREAEFTVVGEETVQTPTGAERAWVIDSFTEPAFFVRYFISARTRQELGYLGMGFRQSLSTNCPKLI